MGMAGRGTEVYAVVWYGEDGADVHLFADERAADAKYLALCGEWDVHPGLGYKAEGIGFNDWQRGQEPTEPYSAVWGEKACGVQGPELLTIG